MERQGVCLACHKEIPDARFAYKMISKLGSSLGMVPETDTEHMALIGKAMFIAANVQIFGPLAAIAVVLLFIWLIRRRRAA
jgi:hypothetical protein